MTNEDILEVLNGLDDGVRDKYGNAKGFEIEFCEDAWYSQHTHDRLAKEIGYKVPEVAARKGCVRVMTPGQGALEIHIIGDLAEIKCYCCFGGNPDKGKFPLDQLRSAVEDLKDHYCPPWPG